MYKRPAMPGAGESDACFAIAYLLHSFFIKPAQGLKELGGFREKAAASDVIGSICQGETPGISQAAEPNLVLKPSFRFHSVLDAGKKEVLIDGRKKGS